MVTLDGEVMAVNGRVLSGHAQLEHKFNPGREPDAASVCSCTCYGTRKEIVSNTHPAKTGCHKAIRRMAKMFGCQDLVGLDAWDDSNFYDEENQSISNHTRLAVKRASF